MPSYLFCIIAGPFKEIKGENTYKNIPMSLFCRESLFEHLSRISELTFEITNKSMKVYEEFFGVPFPFNKYD